MASTTAGVAELLAERGLAIPPAQIVPAGVRLTYRRLVRWQNIAHIAGHGPTYGDGWGSPLGEVGRFDLYGEDRLAARTSFGVPTSHSTCRSKSTRSSRLREQA